MDFTSSEHLLARSTRTATNQLGEFVHVCAIYLGIAVLVTIVLGAIVPSLREQSRQMHAALVFALRPAGLKEVSPLAFESWQDSFGSGSYGQDAVSTDPSAAIPPASGALPSVRTPGSAPLINFSQALSASIAGQAIRGITDTQAQALRSYISRKYKIAHSVAGALVDTAFTVGREKKLDPQLLLAVIAIESRYNPYAESQVGAQGLMQVMTKVHKEKFDLFGEGLAAALNPIANIRVGSQILQDCITRRGSLEGGLACYVGATGPSDGGYGASVLAERRRIALASGIPVGRD